MLHENSVGTNSETDSRKGIPEVGAKLGKVLIEQRIRVGSGQVDLPNLGPLTLLHKPIQARKRPSVQVVDRIDTGHMPPDTEVTGPIAGPRKVNVCEPVIKLALRIQATHALTSFNEINPLANEAR